MSSILNNPAALSALQALQMTQQALSTVQNQVSTGLKVATAADNSSYWSIAAQLNADSGVVQASNDALSQGQSMLATAKFGDQFGHHDHQFDPDRAHPGDGAGR
jgi:flagellin